MNRIKTIVAAAILAAGPGAYAADGVSFEYGHSDSTNASVKLYRVGMHWDWGKRWFDTGSWSLGGYWDLSVGYWDNESAGRTSSSLSDIGLTPVFRWQQNSPKGVSPYVEAGVGFRFLSKSSVSTQREFGSNFQFGDHVGVGLRLGDKGQFEVGYRYQHISNAGIKAPNQGINFNQVRFAYHF